MAGFNIGCTSSSIPSPLDQIISKTYAASRKTRCPATELTGGSIPITTQAGWRRAILLLRYQDGLDYRTIAEVVGSAEGTVASRLTAPYVCHVRSCRGAGQFVETISSTVRRFVCVFGRQIFLVVGVELRIPNEPIDLGSPNNTVVNNSPSLAVAVSCNSLPGSRSAGPRARKHLADHGFDVRQNIRTHMDIDTAVLARPG